MKDTEADMNAIDRGILSAVGATINRNGIRLTTSAGTAVHRDVTVEEIEVIFNAFTSDAVSAKMKVLVTDSPSTLPSILLCWPFGQALHMRVDASRNTVAYQPEPIVDRWIHLPVCQETALSQQHEEQSNGMMLYAHWRGKDIDEIQPLDRRHSDPDWEDLEVEEVDFTADANRVWDLVVERIAGTHDDIAGVPEEQLDDDPALTDRQ
jgi:hypothetical protein